MWNCQEKVLKMRLISCIIINLMTTALYQLTQFCKLS